MDDDLKLEDELFEAAMGDIGDGALRDEDQVFEDAMRSSSAARGQSRPVRPPVEATARSRDSREDQWLRSEDEVFLDALSKADVAPTATPRPPSAPRADSSRGIGGTRRSLVRRVRQGELLPERTLDLHGFSRDGARQALKSFVATGRREGLRLLLVVTGRGLHSKEGPVLRDQVPSWLRMDCADDVHDLAKAPTSLGGEGALLVVLRPL